VRCYNEKAKKFGFSNRPPASKILRTKDVKSAFYRRSKLAILLKISNTHGKAALSLTGSYPVAKGGFFVS
jgi:hypothetical protein